MAGASPLAASIVDREERMSSPTTATIVNLDKSCAACGDSVGRLLRCTSCLSAYYCSGKNCQKRHWSAHKLLCKREQKLPPTMLGQHELQLVGTFYWAVNGDGDSPATSCVDLTELNVYLSCTDRFTERTRELFLIIVDGFRKLRPPTLGLFLTKEPLGTSLPIGVNGAKCYMVARESEATLYPWSLQGLSTYLKQPAGAPAAKPCKGVSLPARLLTHAGRGLTFGDNVIRLPCYNLLMPEGVPSFLMPPRPEFFTVHTLGWYSQGEGDISYMTVRADPRCDETRGRCFCIDQPRRRQTELIKYSSYRSEGLLSSCMGEGDVVLVYPGIYDSHVWTPKWTAGFELYGVSKETFGESVLRVAHMGMTPYNAHHEGWIITAEKESPRPTRLANFTMSGGSGDGLLVFEDTRPRKQGLEPVKVEILNCEFRCERAGIVVGRGVELHMRNCLVRDSAGYGLRVEAGGVAHLHNCTFRCNAKGWDEDATQDYHPTYPPLVRGIYGAIALDRGSRLSVTGCTFELNYGHAIQLLDEPVAAGQPGEVHVKLDNCTFQHNAMCKPNCPCSQGKGACLPHPQNKEVMRQMKRRMAKKDAPKLGLFPV